MVSFKHRWDSSGKAFYELIKPSFPGSRN
ncbi:hypothetical protein CCACVL1_01685 [Corchorus capsularis]|uniref:Uncharacterized protein n=1 Tax=Corchorus capsularis TaxID=210143 RepID=A0A1R3KGI0_COCAP|nr:hypothetical protein CCACVL1_01685 [Corchorus capsularis]